MRFNNPEEVKAWADKVAAEDYARHLMFGIDLNPYCTDGARSCWQRGYDGSPAYSWERLEWDTQYQRGAAAARVVAQNQR